MILFKIIFFTHFQPIYYYCFVSFHMDKNIAQNIYEFLLTKCFAKLCLIFSFTWNKKFWDLLKMCANYYYWPFPISYFPSILGQFIYFLLTFFYKVWKKLFKWNKGILDCLQRRQTNFLEMITFSKRVFKSCKGVCKIV